MRNREYTRLDGLKYWIEMPPDAEYAAVGPGLLGRWETTSCTLFGFEYDIEGRQEQHFTIRTTTPDRNITARLDSSTLFCIAGEPLKVHAKLASRDQSRTIRLFVALKVGESYFFWPEWTGDIQYFDLHVTTDRVTTLDILDLIWPDLAVVGESFQLLTVAVDPFSGELLTPLNTIILHY